MLSSIMDGVTTPSPSCARSSPVGLILLAAMVTASSTACAAAPPPGGVNRIGETVECQGWRVTVHGFYQLPPDRWYEPDEGYVHCAVEVTLENASGQILFVMPEKQMLLLDGDRHAHAPDRNAAVVAARTWEWFPPEGEMSVGEKAHGALSYQVSRASPPTRWVFCTSLLPWSERVVFALGELQTR